MRPIWVKWQLFIFGVAVLLLAVGAIAYVAARKPASPTLPPGKNYGHTIHISGRIVCLPHKDTSGPQTMECAYGLHGDDTYYYGLLGLDQERLIDGTISPQKYVSVVGTLQRPATNDKYDIYGSIDVDNIDVH